MSAYRNDGGPAFPEVVIQHPNGDFLPARHITDCGGMTLRDYFAGQALAGLAVNWNSGNSISKASYVIADAMIEARGK